MTLPTWSILELPYTTLTKKGIPIANGFPFASGQPGFRPASLRYILAELNNDIYSVKFNLDKLMIQPEDIWGSYQAKQGVLMWNLSPTTTSKGEDHSMIWKEITDKIISYLNKKTALVWLVFTDKFDYHVNDNHLVLQIGNPKKILGKRPFSEANKYLQLHGKEIIDW